MKKMTKRQSDIIQYTFLVFLIIFTGSLVSSTLDIGLLSIIVKHIDIKYILLGLMCIVIYITIESTIIGMIIRSISNVDVKYIGTKIATLGLYYNLVTPFASGSQPMQIYALSKYKISISKAMAIVTNKTILFQSVVTIYCAVLLFIKSEYILNSQLNYVFMLVLTGIVFNLITLIGGIFIIINPVKLKKYIGLMIKWLSKYTLFKFLVSKEYKIYRYIDEYHNSIKLIIKDTKMIILSIILTFIQLSVYFSISYCVYKSFSLNETSYITLLTLQVFLYMAVSPIPTPGNVGANEIGFMTIFQSIFPKEIIGYSVFLYGGFVYYFMLIISGLFTIKTHYDLSKID